MKDKWIKLANKRTIEKTMSALKENGIDAVYFNSVVEAKQEALQLLPEGAEVMTMTSTTLETLNIAKEINSSGRYNSVRNKLESPNKEEVNTRKLGAAPEWTIGSVHAVTQDGKIVIASNTGSQLPAYAHGSKKVIFIIGTQKIVRNLDKAFKRIYEHSLPLESERAKKAYGVPGSSVNKMLIINREIQPERIKVIFVNAVLGF
jgi:L-lactate utilization protein LutC